MLEGPALEHCLAPLSFDCDALVEGSSLRRKACQQLRRHGLLLLRRAVDAQRMEALAEVEHSAWRHASQGSAGDRNAPVLLNRGQERAIRGYRRLVAARKAVISIRANEDNGMLDVFHPERLEPHLHDLVVTSLREPLVTALLEQAFATPFHVRARNLYVNRGVTSTRGFHTDGGGIKAKAFLYLSDVESLAEGPFCYVPGSHRRPWLRWLNRGLFRGRGVRRDDCPWLPLQRALPVFCAAGDMVVAMQHGVHRGLPQQPTAERTVLLSMLQP
ncbi:hypothetical protein [Cyanobium sp. NIES-981]|uniref:hypothetical protein n=1 Tax=Cyanobium sp. NIES-981 TaxID=1851505 RepID=UPI0007DCFF94|nr:hypothetical protein [Cyanobium sp. NIES-981]SBO42362.1 conserved protein of unknown function [Cyanobium sp. NIES-981]